MGLDRQSLPDSVLRRVSPADRKAASLPAPMAEVVAKATAKSDVKREKELQEQIANWLRLHGITAIRSRMDRATSNNCGTPDFLFAVRGHAVALEAKLPGCHPTEDQRRVMAGLERDGWRVAVVRSLDEARQRLAGWQLWPDS